MYRRDHTGIAGAASEDWEEVIIANDESTRKNVGLHLYPNNIIIKRNMQK